MIAVVLVLLITLGERYPHLEVHPLGSKGRGMLKPAAPGSRRAAFRVCIRKLASALGTGPHVPPELRFLMPSLSQSA